MQNTYWSVVVVPNLFYQALKLNIVLRSVISVATEKLSTITILICDVFFNSWYQS